MVLDIKKVWLKYCKLWNDLSGWKLFLFYALHYTLLFVLLQQIVFSEFYKTGKSLINGTDGACSYLPRLIYISQTVRNCIQSFFSGGDWTIPLYDFRIGPAQLDLQVEPIQLLAILWPWDKLDVLYETLVLLRYYLAGLAFSLLGFYFKQKPLPIVIGTISYIFCGFSLYGGVIHPFFLAAMFFLPLLIMGAEDILKGKKSFLFTFTVFLALISNLYFACMLAILIVLYIFIRLFCVYKHNAAKSFIQILYRTILWGGTGVLLSGIVVVPTLLQMLGTGRIGRDVGNLLYYTIGIYEKMVSNFIVIPNAVITGGLFGFSVLAVPLIIMYFVGKGENRKSLKILFVVLTLMFCSPLISYIMSGFNDTSGRWGFAYALCVSSIIMFELSQLQGENKYVLASGFCVSLVYIIVCYFILNRNYYREEPLVLLILSLLIVVCCYIVGGQGRKLIVPICLFLTVISVYYSASLRFSSDIARFADTKTVYGTYMGTQYASLGQSGIVQNDDDFFRVSASNLDKVDAIMSFYWDLNGLSLYTSSILDSYKVMENSLEIMQRKQNNWKFGIEGRASLLSLFNVKYYAIRGKAPVPYGFFQVDRNDRDIILENKYFLPLGYTYDKYISKDQFNLLNPVAKQEAMLQAAVVDDNINNINVSSENVNILSQELPAKVVKTDGLNWENGVLQVDEEKATMTLAFDGIGGADTYIRVENLDLTSGGNGTYWNLGLTTNNSSTYVRFASDAYIYSHGMKTQVIYLGNSPDGYTTCTLTFPQKGTFILDDLEIWCQPMDNYAAQIDALRAEPLENIETNWRGVKGTVDLSKDKIMCFGIPYETGWSVYVDGEKRELMQANIGLIAVELESGYHNIELKYWMPGLTIGILLSCLGVLSLVGLIFYNKKFKKITNKG